MFTVSIRTSPLQPVFRVYSTFQTRAWAEKVAKALVEAGFVYDAKVSPPKEIELG